MGRPVSGEWQVTHLLNQCRNFLKTLEHLVIDLVWPPSLLADLEKMRRILADPPPGDPTSIETLAQGFRSAAAAVEVVRADLERAKAGLPDIVVGVAAGTASQAAAALATGLGHEVSGLRASAEALTRYAASLRTAIRVHAQADDRFEDAARHLRRCSGLTIEVLGVDTHVPDLIAVVREVGKAVGDAIEAVRIALRSYEQAEDALYALQRAGSDARGWAVRASAPHVPGFSVLDVAVMVDQWRVANPDARILDPDQWARVAALLSGLTPQQRAALNSLLARAGSPAQRAVLLSALAAGATPEQLNFVADAIRVMSEDQLLRMMGLNTDKEGRATMGLDGVIQDPTTGNTCGSTSLLALLARVDPMLALWLTSGERAPGWNPAYLAHLTDAQWRGSTFIERFIAAQHSVLTTTDSDLSTWPEALGTPPWGAASLATLGSPTAYESVLYDDQEQELARELMSRAAEAANNGTPVPFYAGDDYTPRHVLLITGYASGVYTVYEPGTGSVIEVPESVMLGNGSPGAFGGWTHIDYLVLPVH